MTNGTLILLVFNFFPMIESLPINFCVQTFTPVLTKRTFAFIYISFVFKISLLCLDMGENELLCYIYFLCVQNFCCCVWIWVLFVPNVLKKKFMLEKGWSFWGFISEPPQGMLCLVIELFRVRSKKIMEGTNIC